MSAPPKPQRPPSGSRDGSSWLNRLHRHHDLKHHTPAEEEEERPLLTSDTDVEYLNSDDTEAQASAPSPSHRFRRSR